MALSRSARNRRGRRQRTNNSPSRTRLTIRNRRGRATGSRLAGSLRNFGSNYKTKELKAADLARSSRYATSEYKSDGGPKEKSKKTAPQSTSSSTPPRTAEKKSTKKPVRSNEPSLHTWAKANRKMIERSGTARQKAILKEALKVKKNESKAKAQKTLFRSKEYTA